MTKQTIKVLDHLTEKYQKTYRQANNTIRSQFTIDEFIEWCIEWECITFTLREYIKLENKTP